MTITLLDRVSRTPPITAGLEPLEAWWASAPFVRIVGDIHGSYESFAALCRDARWRDGKVFLLGDIVNRGPRSPDCMRLFLEGLDAGWLRFVPGNHDHRLAVCTLTPDQVLEEFNDLGGCRSTLDQIRSSDDASVMDAFCRAMMAAPVHQRILDTILAHGAMPDGTRSGQDGPPPLLKEATRKPSLNSAARTVWGYAQGPGKPPCFSWVHEVPRRTTVIVGHYPASRAHPLRVTGARGGRVFLMDTGAGVYEGRSGPVSWLDLAFRDLRRPDFGGHVPEAYAGMLPGA
jgi:hypothetical protein